MRRTLCVFNRNRESFLALHVAPADTWRMRMQGLLGRSRLAPDDGLWLVSCSSIHSIGMRFAVDLIYLDSENRVIHLVEEFRPFRISPFRKQCAGILELRTRTIYSSNTQIGDELLVCAPEEIQQYVKRNRTGFAIVNGRK